MSQIPVKRSPWYWVPSLYFAEGIPYAVVMLISVVFYKRMGISNTDIALYTSWLYLPWVIKPLWSPVVDILRTKRFWIITTQLIIGAGLGGVALSIPMPSYFKFTIGFLWLLAFSSATHDIAADGFYMLGLNQRQQAWFVGIRSTFYRIAMIIGQGLLIILAGAIESNTGLETVAVEVQAVRASVETVAPEAAGTIDEGQLAIICDPAELTIPIETRTRAEFDSTWAFVEAWNSAQGQVPENGEVKENKTVKDESAWKKYISRPAENTIRRFFGAKSSGTRKSIAGNFGIVRLRLSDPPGKETVISFGRVSGDKSVSLLTPPRIVFTDGNWDKPVLAVIQLDHRLKNPVLATFQARSGNTRLAWVITFLIIGGLFFLFFIYHRFMLPFPESDTSGGDGSDFWSNFLETLASFFTKENSLIAITFILLYRLGEAQLVKMAVPFMLDAQEVGGLALTTGQIGFVYGTIGLLMLTLGGILGGIVAARQGLKYWIIWMALAMNIPNLVYVYLSHFQPDNFVIINICVGFEQFGYGFGFTAYMLYMISVAEGRHKTAHYALCTGFMALGMMIPGMFSGWLQELIGYQHFFIWVVIATIPGFILIKFLSIDPEFGKKEG